MLCVIDDFNALRYDFNMVGPGLATARHFKRESRITMIIYPSILALFSL